LEAIIRRPDPDGSRILPFPAAAKNAYAAAGPPSSRSGRQFDPEEDDMSPTPDTVIRQWFKEVWDEGKEEAIDRLFAADGTVSGLTGPDGPPLVGPAAFRPIFNMFREALGDLEVIVERTLVDGDLCTAHCRVKGRHVGRALGGEPTNRPVDFAGMTIARVRDGQLVEGWNVFDFLTMYQQIGWVPNPVTPPS
jgi:predicted ester cyclase